MNNDKWPFPDPRVLGVHEHYERVRMFFELAHQSTDPIKSFRFLVAGVYFARGIVELIFEAADKEQLRVTRDQIKQVLPDKLPWYNLVERIRIHDFHRFGLIPPSPNMKVMFQGGQIKLRAQKGAATYSIQSTGPKVEFTGASSIKEQRPLLSKDGRFFDQETGKYVTLEQILKDFLDNIPAVIAEFEKDLEG